MADGILQRVIGSFNPFCEGDKDPLTKETDQCANYPTPPDAEVCLRPSEKPQTKSTAGERNGVVPYLLYAVLLVTPNLYLNNLIVI